MAVEPRDLPSDNHLDEIVSILDIVRSGFARTKPEIARHTGLGRNMVTQRVNQLLAIGLIEEQGLAASSGGRNPRALRFRGDAGQVLVAHLGAMHFSAGCADLQGNITAQHREPCEVADGPKIVLDRVCDVFDRLLSQHPGDVWGIGVGLPGPVDFSSARTIAPPIMPGWDRYDVRGHLVDRFGSAVWVDNDVNLMAIGEVRDGLARGQQNMVYIKIGTGVGAGLISNGRSIAELRAVPETLATSALSRTPPSLAAAGSWGVLRRWRVRPHSSIRRSKPARKGAATFSAASSTMAAR